MIIDVALELRLIADAAPIECRGIIEATAAGLDGASYDDIVVLQRTGDIVSRLKALERRITYGPGQLMALGHPAAPKRCDYDTQQAIDWLARECALWPGSDSCRASLAPDAANARRMDDDPREVDLGALAEERS